MDRREFLKTAAAAASAFGLPPQDPKPKATLDALLAKYRARQLSGRGAGGPGGGNHIPLTLVSLYRMGADSACMDAYAAGFNLEAAPPRAARGTITEDIWEKQLGRASFIEFLAYFESAIRKTSVEVVLKAALPALSRGVAAVAFHSLLRLGFALDIGSNDEIAFALADWAAGFQPSPDYAEREEAVEPADLLADAVKRTADFKLNPRSGIVDRLNQVYGSADFAKALRPVKIADSKPLDAISRIIMERFTDTHDFTVLHALTSCQAMRLMLPYLKEPVPAVTRYWHAICAAWVGVVKARPTGKDAVADRAPAWEELLSKAAAAGLDSLSAYEHTVKLVYASWSESKHYERDAYRAVAAREITKPCRFV